MKGVQPYVEGDRSARGEQSMEMIPIFVRTVIFNKYGYTVWLQSIIVLQHISADTFDEKPFSCGRSIAAIFALRSKKDSRARQREACTGRCKMHGNIGEKR